METAKRSFETALFGDKVSSTEQNPKPAGFDTDGSNAVVSKVNGTTADGRVGPGVILKVMAGDKYKASTYAWYQPTGMDNTVNTALGDIVVNLLTQLTPGVAYVGKGELAGGATNAILQPGLKSFSGTQAPAAGAPKAYLNYILLDEKSFKLVQSGAASVPQITGTMQKQLLQLNSGSDITVTHNGYLYVWVSNESKGNVYFDDIRVEHQQGPLLEENHYYPYGLKMAALCSKAFGSLLNKFQYQGSYSEFDEETGYDEFTLRNYDPQLGRWTGVDPYGEFPSPYTGMGNEPVNTADPSGGEIDPLREVVVTTTVHLGLQTLGNQIKSLVGGQLFQNFATNDWYRNKNKKIVYDNSVHKQSDLKDEKGNSKGEYLGKSGTGTDEETGNEVEYTKDGKIIEKPHDLPTMVLAPSKIDWSKVHGTFGYGVQFSGGAGIGKKSFGFSFGVFGKPGGMGQLFITFSIPTSNAYFDASVSEQFLVGYTSNDQFDLSGRGYAVGGGYDFVSGSYATDTYQNPSYHIVGVGPTAGLKITGGPAQSQTFTTPTYIPRMIGVLRW